MNDKRYVIVNLKNVITKLGEDRVKAILSAFSCPLNKDVEDFIRNKAIVFSNQGLAQTHLVYYVNGKEKHLVGYFTLSNTKVIAVEKDTLSKTMTKKMAKFATSNGKAYTIVAPLIAQLSKNFADGNDTLISGVEILEMACNKLKEVQREVGGRIIYLECEDKEKLKNFYEDYGFQFFGKRILDGDERSSLYGEYLLQYLYYIKD